MVTPVIRSGTVKYGGYVLVGNGHETGNLVNGNVIARHWNNGLGHNKVVTTVRLGYVRQLVGMSAYGSINVQNSQACRWSTPMELGYHAGLGHQYVGQNWVIQRNNWVPSRRNAYA